MCYKLTLNSIYYFFFFFRQKTEYEMRMSDWSSDVCSSDLYQPRDRHAVALEPFELGLVGRPHPRLALAPALQAHLVEQYLAELLGAADGEGLARETVYLALHAKHVVRELDGQPCQIGEVDQESGAQTGAARGDERAVEKTVKGGC